MRAPSVPLGGAFWDGGAQTFINKGVNGRWRDMLSAEDCAAYQPARAGGTGTGLRPLAGMR